MWVFVARWQDGSRVLFRQRYHRSPGVDLIMEVTRRVFSAAAAAAAFAPVGKARPLDALSPGIKISMQVDENVSDEDLVWIKQMGVDYLNVQTGSGRATLENFLAIKKRVEAAGLTVWNRLNNDNRNNRDII